jgi:hypothetical protein
MDVEEMCEILEEFAREFTVGNLKRGLFLQFLVYNDLGLPLAQAYHYDLAELTEEGETLVIETWEEFCRRLAIDSDEPYEDLNDCLFSSEVYLESNE